MQVSYASWVNPISSWLGLSFQELGLKELQSLTSGTLLGWSWLAEDLDPVSQTRSSSEAFLREALEETTNLALYKSTLAKKIIIEGGKAKGVSVDSGGVTYILSASKEVIICAGVVRALEILSNIDASDAPLDTLAADAHCLRYRAKADSRKSGYRCHRG